VRPTDLLYRLYERRLAADLRRRGGLPRHVGVILDGNRRWARELGMVSAEGHRRGAAQIDHLLAWARELGIPVVTLWLLSTENLLQRHPDELAELLEAPVTTSLQGKSAFPETHPLSLGSGGRSISKQLHHFLNHADLIFGIGCSFSTTNYGVAMPKGKRIAHATLDPTDINKDVASELALVGDAGLTLQALLVEVKDRLKGGPRGRFSVVTQEIKNLKSEWLAQWTPRLTADTKPLSPYRVLWDLMHTVDVANTIITHDAGSPRDQISPFWEPVAPLSYIGWGKTTQLGYGLGLAMGAKLAAPDKLCVNVWGDAAIGFTGMDFETAVRERIPILSVLLNNFSMAIELKVMKTATAKYRSTDISGDYAAMARAFGGHGERVTEPGEIVPAIRRAIKKTQEGTPALLEFITEKAEDFSMF